MVSMSTLPADARLRNFISNGDPDTDPFQGHSAESNIEIPEEICDLAVDYYGKRLAVATPSAVLVYQIAAAGSASGDILSKIATGTDDATLLARLESPDIAGPLQQIGWCDPSQGSMIVACGQCGSVVVYRETSPRGFSLAWKEKIEGAATSVQFGPKEFGMLSIAVGSTSGLVTIFDNSGGSLARTGVLKAHLNGVSSLSWSTPISPATLASGPAVQSGYLMPANAPRRLVTAGSDCNVKVWRYHSEDKKWVEECALPGGDGIVAEDTTPAEHRGPLPDGGAERPEGPPALPSHDACVRAVAWRPNVGIPSNFLASGAEDGSCKIWVQEMEGQPWRKASEIRHDTPVYRAHWSVTGLCLCLSIGDEAVCIYKQSASGEWLRVDGTQSIED
ncbi:unnamed protein product [Amoebophrya sp. A25]|nr:unnamed protein product [Amoebophrya sp. A25]|eukprot:GSA25T00001758001.1